MKIQSFTNIQDVNKSIWEQNLNELEYFHNTTFLEIVQNSAIQNCKLEFLTISEENEIIATAVVGVFTMELNMFIKPNFFTKTIKKISPNFFNINLIFCGTPVSIGHSNLYINLNFKDKTQEIINLIQTKIDELSKRHKVNFFSFKEFREKEATELESSLINNDYFKAHSLPTIDLIFDEENYFESLSKNKRRQINNSLKKIGFTFQNINFNTLNQNGFLFSIKAAKDFSPDLFHANYLKILGRSKTKFETLNLEFFNFFFKKENGTILSLEKDNAIIASFLFLEQANSITFVWVSRENKKDDFDSYFNLMSAMIKWAVQKQKKVIYLGQTTYYTKMRMGGKPEGLYLFFKAKNKLLNKILKIANRFIFPEIKL